MKLDSRAIGGGTVEPQWCPCVGGCLTGCTDVCKSCTGNCLNICVGCIGTQTYQVGRALVIILMYEFKDDY